MSNFVGIPPYISCIFSRIFHGFINILETINQMICILDHLINVMGLKINLKKQVWHSRTPSN